VRDRHLLGFNRAQGHVRFSIRCGVFYVRGCSCSFGFDGCSSYGEMIEFTRGVLL
jgi:hypothetical protein